MDRCCICNQDSDHCDCQCPECGQYCFDDVTLADHSMCYDCHKARLNGEI